jgi:hypothetical protein
MIREKAKITLASVQRSPMTAWPRPVTPSSSERRLSRSAGTPHR